MTVTQVQPGPPLTLRDPLPNGQFERVLIDWDSLDERDREGLLAGLLAEPQAGRLGLTSYGLNEDDAEALHGKGVNVFARLDPDALGWLIEGGFGQANPPIPSAAPRPAWPPAAPG
jgi:hypothetical protein